MSSHGHEHEHHSLKAYYLVYLLLMVGLVATVWVAYFDLGVLGTPVAMLIATIKATLVVWIFMHVKDATPMIWVTIIMGLVGLALGFIFLFSDYLAR
jgi:cytochrome c oxidase subunit IV